MLKQSSVLLVSLFCGAFAAQAMAKTSSEYLKEYQNLVNKTHKQAIASIPPAEPATPPSIATGQAALVPVLPKTAPPTQQEMPATAESAQPEW